MDIRQQQPLPQPPPPPPPPENDRLLGGTTVQLSSDLNLRPRVRIRRHVTAATVACCCSELGVAAAICFAFDRALHNPYCALLFRCGCSWEWSGGWSNCNVHNPAQPLGATERGGKARCPWCAVMDGDLSGLAPFITHEATVMVMVAAYAAVWSGHLRVFSVAVTASAQVVPAAVDGNQQKAGRVERLVAAATTFYLWGFVWGVVFYLGTDYPCFVYATDYASSRCGGTAGRWWSAAAGALGALVLLIGVVAAARCNVEDGGTWYRRLTSQVGVAACVWGIGLWLLAFTSGDPSS